MHLLRTPGDAMSQPTATDLADIALFASLDDAQRAAFAERFTVEEHRVGHPVVLEGKAGYAFYIVASGRLSVTQEGRELRTLGPGDFFGEISIIGDGRRTATVTATEPSELWVLFGTEFRVLQSSHPTAAALLQQAVEERLAADRA